MRSLEQGVRQVVLDLDRTNDPLYGQQEGRFFHGYYDEYCYTPLYIFAGDWPVVAALIYGGTHFLSGDLDGLRLGQAIGHYVNDNFLLPLGDLPRLRMVRLPEGEIQVAVEGTPGSPAILECSPGLGEWSAMTTNAPPFALVEPAAGSGRFYRARRLR